MNKKKNIVLTENEMHKMRDYFYNKYPSLYRENIIYEVTDTIVKYKVKICQNHLQELKEILNK